MVLASTAWLQRSLQRISALLVAAAAGWLAHSAHLPLPWMLGPLFSIAILRVVGLPLTAMPGSRHLGQWAIGTALGLYFTPAVLAELVRYAPEVLAMSVSSVVLGFVAAVGLERWAKVERSTAFFAGLPGGASEMVVLAERYGGQLDRVAAAHALRVMLVVSIVPFVLHHAAIEGHEQFRAASGVVDWRYLPWLIGVSLAGIALFVGLRIGNPWVLGPLVAVGVLTASGVALSSLPVWLVNGGQLLLGTALGNRFSPSFFRAAPRLLGVSTAITLLVVLLSALFVGCLSGMTPIPLPSMLLAASPGGMAEMSITAREMHLSVPLVTATHVLRVVALTVFAPWLWRFYQILRGSDR